MSIQLPDLPYDNDALEPHISARTLEYHHGKHHKGYIDKLNKAIANTAYEDMALDGIIVRSHRTTHDNVYNNAAQAWNHEFLWNSMSPDGGGEPDGVLKEAIERDFGSVDMFRKAFRQAAVGQFGSGWAWLVLEQGILKVLATDNAESPLTSGQRPLLVLDVWEHAYYLDYQNDRGAYVDNFLENLINWEFAATHSGALQAAA